MTKLSKRAIEALNRNETDEVFLYCLEIEVEGEEAWRFVNNNEDIISNGKRYTACGFTVSLPSQKNETLRAFPSSAVFCLVHYSDRKSVV